MNATTKYNKTQSIFVIEQSFTVTFVVPYYRLSPIIISLEKATTALLILMFSEL